MTLTDQTKLLFVQEKKVGKKEVSKRQFSGKKPLYTTQILRIIES